MEKIFVSPQRYIQGENVLKKGLHYISSLGDKLLLITDPFVWRIAGEELASDLAHLGIEVTLANFSGESSNAEIRRIAKEAERAEVAAVVALGGGSGPSIEASGCCRTNSCLNRCPYLLHLGSLFGRREV